MIDVLAGLDPDQRQIAETLRGPVAVRAGAGTGKTRTITSRIAHGVRTGVYAPERVLAVTFTRKAAGEMQGRLRALGAEGVKAQTFHGAALSQLGFFWPQLVGGVAPQILNSKIAAVSQAVEAMGMRLSRETLRDIVGEIEWRKVSMLNLEDYAALLGRAESPRAVPTGLTATQLVDIQDRYSQVLYERRQIDFEDVLALMTGMLETEPRAALQMREQYRFFTVDEFQDVSPLQHALLNVWLGDRDDVCVVGDASQTIYSFAGASSSYLLRFQQQYPHAREFRLERNYRSTEPIVKLANRLMRDQPGALTLIPQRKDSAANETRPTVEWFRNESDEAAAVAASIRSSIAAGTPVSQIAVLYRTNAQSAAIEAALAQAQLGVRVQGGQRFFDRAEVKQAVMLIRGQAKVHDPRPLFQVISDVLSSCGWRTSPPEGDAARERWQSLNAILTLVDEQQPGTTVQQFSEELLARQGAHHEPTLDSVTLSAVHAAKGLEWSLVHLIGMTEGVFPTAYAQSEEQIDEERRLAYVAFTRARNVLRISGTSGSARAGRAPSRFLHEAGLIVES